MKQFEELMSDMLRQESLEQLLSCRPAKESDFRKEGFENAQAAEYEVREDGEVLRVDRFRVFAADVARTMGASEEWELIDLADAVRAMADDTSLATNKRDSQIASELRGIAADADDAAPTTARVLRGAADRINALSANAARYEHLRAKDLEQAQSGGLFAGLTPDNVVINGDDLDDAIDREMTS